eukprot:scaffold39024_cov72-Cyclotella_meneghiniana.AAC.7
MSYYEYNKWLDKVEIGIHYPQPLPHSDFEIGDWNSLSAPQPLPHPDFSVTGVENFGSRKQLTSA